MPGHSLDPFQKYAGRWFGAGVLILALHVAAGAAMLAHWQTEPEDDDTSGAVVIELSDLAVAPETSAATEAESTPPTPEMQKVEEPKPETPPEEQPPVEEAPKAPEPEVTLPKPEPIKEEPAKEEPKEELIKEPEEKKPEPVDAAAQPATPPEAASPPPVPAAPAPVAAAKREGLTAAEIKAKARWQTTLSTKINKFKRYPRAASVSKQQGKVGVEFTMNRLGQVLASRVVASSGSELLDNAGLDAVQRASPLPAPPDFVVGEIFTYKLEFKFRVR